MRLHVWLAVRLLEANRLRAQRLAELAFEPVGLLHERADRTALDALADRFPDLWHRVSILPLEISDGTHVRWRHRRCRSKVIRFFAKEVEDHTKVPFGNRERRRLESVEYVGRERRPLLLQPRDRQWSREKRTQVTDVDDLPVCRRYLVGTPEGIRRRATSGGRALDDAQRINASFQLRSSLSLFLVPSVDTHPHDRKLSRREARRVGLTDAPRIPFDTGRKKSIDRPPLRVADEHPVAVARSRPRNPSVPEILNLEPELFELPANGRIPAAEVLGVEGAATGKLIPMRGADDRLRVVTLPVDQQEVSARRTEPVLIEKS